MLINPLVSICVPTYNGQAYLQDTLNCISKQTYKPIEVIISDDASSDYTLTLVETFKKQSSFPVHVYHHQPQGIAENWNNCVRYANGTYIKFLFQDDLMTPDCVEKMMQLALLDKKVGLVYCTREFLISGKPEDFQDWLAACSELHKSWDDLEIKPGIISGKRYLRDAYLRRSPGNKIGEPTAVLLKKACFNKVGYFNKALRQNLDNEFWYRLMPYFNVGFIDENLVTFRLHSNQATVVNNEKNIKEGLQLQAIYYKTIFWYLHPKDRWRLFKIYSKIGDLYRKLKAAFK
jgi:glycosyltransferase involved in cell wall biosynthesis